MASKANTRKQHNLKNTYRYDGRHNKSPAEKFEKNNNQSMINARLEEAIFLQHIQMKRWELEDRQIKKSAHVKTTEKQTASEHCSST